MMSDVDTGTMRGSYVDQRRPGRLLFALSVGLGYIIVEYMIVMSSVRARNFLASIVGTF